MAPVTGRMSLAVYGDLTGPVWISQVALYRAKQKPAHEREDRVCDALPTKLVNRSEVIRIKRFELTQQLVVLAVSGVGRHLPRAGTLKREGEEVLVDRGKGRSGADKYNGACSAPRQLQGQEGVASENGK